METNRAYCTWVFKKADSSDWIAYSTQWGNKNVTSHSQIILAYSYYAQSGNATVLQWSSLCTNTYCVNYCTTRVKGSLHQTLHREIKKWALSKLSLGKTQTWGLRGCSEREKKGVKVQFTVFVFVCSVRRKLTENSQVFFDDKRLCFPQWGESIWATPLWQKRGGIWYRPHLPHLPPVSLSGCTGAAAQEHKTEIEEKKKH